MAFTWISDAEPGIIPVNSKNRAIALLELTLPRECLMRYNWKKTGTMIQLRPATLQDLALLEYWDAQPHVIACDPDSDWNWKVELRRSPAWREQLIAELNTKPLGMIQIIDPSEEETKYWGQVEPNKRAIDIWIGDASNLNQGYGTIMMKLAIERCFADPKVTSILIDPLKSNTKAHRFYERLGFEFLEERQFEDSACFVYELKRASWQGRHYKGGSKRSF